MYGRNLNNDPHAVDIYLEACPRGCSFAGKSNLSIVAFYFVLNSALDNPIDLSSN